MLAFNNLSYFNFFDINLSDIKLYDIISLYRSYIPLYLQFIIIPLIIILIKNNHTIELLNDDIQHLLILKDKIKFLTSKNEELLIKNQSLKKSISERVSEIEIKNETIEKLSSEIKILSNRQIEKTVPFKEPKFGNGLSATPLFIAASATAGASSVIKRGSNGLGIRYSGPKLSSCRP